MTNSLIGLYGIFQISLFSFTHPHVIPDVYDLLSSVEYRDSYTNNPSLSLYGATE